MVLDDPLAPGHVARRMRVANFAFKMAHLHCFHPYSAMDQDRGNNGNKEAIYLDGFLQTFNVQVQRGHMA